MCLADQMCGSALTAWVSQLRILFYAIQIKLMYSAILLLHSKLSAQVLPHKVKTQYLHFGSHAEYFPLPWKIHEVFSKRSMTKGSIYYIRNMYIQPFSMEVD